MSFLLNGCMWNWTLNGFQKHFWSSPAAFWGQRWKSLHPPGYPFVVWSHRSQRRNRRSFYFGGLRIWKGFRKSLLLPWQYKPPTPIKRIHMVANKRSESFPLNWTESQIHNQTGLARMKSLSKSFFNMDATKSSKCPGYIWIGTFKMPGPKPTSQPPGGDITPSCRLNL